MARILLVSANTYCAPDPVYPIGLSYIETFIKKRFPSFETSIFDFNLSNMENLKKELAQFAPKYIGISLRNIDNIMLTKNKNSFTWYEEIIKVIRANSNAKIILGGAGYSIFPEMLLELLNPDFGIAGEGEECIAELIDALENNKSYEQIEGLVFKKNNTIIFKKRTTFLDDFRVNFDDNLVDYYWKKSGVMNIQTKRGCPLNCIYCSYPVIEGKKVRTANIDNVIETIEYLYRNKGITYFFFTDSVFNLVNDYNVALAEQLIRRNIKIQWGACFSPSNLDEEMLSLFKKSGLTHVEFGTDSLSNTMLQNYRKGFTVDEIFHKSELCYKLDIYFAHYLILGGFGETEETLKETFENAKKIRNGLFFPITGMRIYPCTGLCQKAIDEGVIGVNDSLIESTFYMARDLDLEESTIKKMGKKAGINLYFPTPSHFPVMKVMRMSNKKGPLWEMMIKKK